MCLTAFWILNEIISSIKFPLFFMILSRFSVFCLFDPRLFASLSGHRCPFATSSRNSVFFFRICICLISVSNFLLLFLHIFTAKPISPLYTLIYIYISFTTPLSLSSWYLSIRTIRKRQVIWKVCEIWT